MDMTGEQRIPATREIVWNALNDTAVLQACIPGCQELIKTSDTEMTAVSLVKVGPVTARFAGAVTLSDIDPPSGYRITGEGQGGVAGFAKGSASVTLEPEGDATILRYEVSAQVGGKLSQLGGRLIDSTAKQMSAAFFKRFSEEIEAVSAEPMSVQKIETAIAASSDSGSQSTDTSDTKTFSPRPATPRSARVPSPPVDVTPGIFKHIRTFGIGTLVVLMLIVWFAFGEPLPAHGDMVGTISPNLVYAVQLVLAAAIGYLFGREKRSH